VDSLHIKRSESYEFAITSVSKGFETLAAVNLGAAETDAAGARLHEPNDAPDCGGLARPIGIASPAFFCLRFAKTTVGLHSQLWT
jgi:hypothetical protein